MLSALRPERVVLVMMVAVRDGGRGIAARRRAAQNRAVLSRIQMHFIV